MRTNPQRERTKLLVDELHQVAKNGTQKIIALLNDPDTKVGFGKGDLHPMVLNAITGTAVDKIAKYENWERKGPGEAGDWARALVEGLQRAGGGRIALEVETLPPPQEPARVLDVPFIKGHLDYERYKPMAERSPEAQEKIREWERLRKREQRERARNALGLEAGE